MRRIAEIEATTERLTEKRNKAKSIEDKMYYNGILNALEWVRDKGGKETILDID